MRRRKSARKRAQVWFSDFMIGMLIFTIVIVIYYEYAYTVDQSTSKITSEFLMDAKSISSSLVTQGSPPDWNEASVEMIGITDGNQRVVQSKLDEFADMNYTFIRSKLRTAYELYVFFEDLEGQRILIDGNEGIGLVPTNSDNLVALTRIVIYNSELVKMVVQVWQ